MISVTDTTPTAPVRQRASQNRKLANAMLIAYQLIDSVQRNPELAAVLAERGYDEAKLGEGLALYQAAEASFNRRQQAIADQQEATNLLKAHQALVKAQYYDFRIVGRGLFRGQADRTALVLSGLVSADRQQLIASAQTSYKAALQERYLPDLSKYGGFSREVIEAAIADVKKLAAMDDDQNAAIAQAVLATEDRDRAATELQDWVTQFRAVARVALRGRTELQKALEVQR
jgi:hypothetical protein